uniref:Uncharacterized protein n=1 Tax=Callorhinchus milii TaxID=7868 RepID=A0A4W3IUF6_CALMI
FLHVRHIFHHPQESTSSSKTLPPRFSPTLNSIIPTPQFLPGSTTTHPFPHLYLYFYKETMDLLVENVIVSVEQIGLPIVSKAISHLWQGMSAEKKAVIFKKCLSPSKAITLQLPMQMDYSLRDKMLDSQGASASSESTPDEMLFEDAFDFASGSTFTHCASENPEETCTLYKQIVNFVKAQCDAATHLLQVRLVKYRTAKY